MSTGKKLAVSLVCWAWFGLLPFAVAQADEGRYLVKSSKAFWRNALGVRHSFDNGFTTDLSDFQLRFAKLWGVEIEPVKVLQILPEKQSVADVAAAADIAAAELLPTPAKKNDLGPKLNAKPTSARGRQIPSDQTPWGVETVYNSETIVKTTGGANVKVAVLDTGVLVSHPDLKARIAQCRDFTNPRTAVVDGKCDDKNGHGTHVAGIIAADGGSDGLGIYGIAPEAKLFVYKVCGANGSCYADDIATALRLAADEGANLANMSFGGDGESGLIRDAVNYAVSKQVLPAAAAGNDGPFPASIDYPAAQAEVMAIGALDQKGVTDWSSRGTNSDSTSWVVEEKDIEFALPGANIESTWNNNGYVILSGTSMASPFAIGLAAKYWQSDTNSPAAATRDRLHRLAVDLLPLGDDNASGFGLPLVQN